MRKAYATAYKALQPGSLMSLKPTPDALSCRLEVVAFCQRNVSSNNSAISRKAFATVANVLEIFIRQIREFFAMANVASG